MKKVAGVLLAVGLCLSLCLSSLADTVSVSDVPDDLKYYNILFSLNSGYSVTLWSELPYFKENDSLTTHDGVMYTKKYKTLDEAINVLQNISSFFSGFEILRGPYRGWFSGENLLSGQSQYSIYSNFSLMYKGTEVIKVNPCPDVSFGGSSSQETIYDSTIPAPENLTYISTKQLSQKLTWTNKLVDSYSVRVSANGRYNDQLTGKPEWHDYNLMIASDGSDGADAGVPASSGGITFSAVDMFQLIGDKYGTVSIKAFEPTEFRVQFYAYVEGVMQVGPVGVVRINKNSAGLWVGSTATVEYPADVGDLGSSGGLYPSGDAWTSDGQGFTDMDKDGNITGSGTVGDEESYVPVGSGPVSLGDFLKDMVNSLLNIPTVLSQLFNSIINAMSGMGELPALVASFFSFLPAEVVALVSLGIIITIVLRIFGR